MKKHIWLIAFLVLLPTTFWGQSTKHLTLRYNTSDFDLRYDHAGNTMITSGRYDVSFKPDTLLPALPYISCQVVIRNTESYRNHSVSTTKNLFWEQTILAKNPEVIPTSVASVPHTDAIQTTYPDPLYPVSNVEYTGTLNYGDFKVLTFLVCPFEYDAVQKKLFFINEFHLNVDLSETTPSPSSFFKANRRAPSDFFRGLVVNPEELDEIYPSRSRQTQNDELMLQTNYEYVIVTNNALKSAFQVLANWKSSKGIRATVLTVDDIDTAYSTGTIQEKIKQTLANMDGLSYVLLGGDTTIVPSQICYIGYNKGEEHYSPGDYYYACTENINWDTNGNGKYGEESDNISIAPMFDVSRLTAANLQEAQSMIQRIISYEGSPVTTGWTDNILMCGTLLGRVDSTHIYPSYFVINGDSISDAQYYGELLYHDYINPSPDTLWSWNGTRYRFYDTGTDFPGGASYDFNRNNLQAEMAKGYTFVDIMTHGGRFAISMENGIDYSWDNAMYLQNSGYTIITTTACTTNAFDNHVIYHGMDVYCFSRHFMMEPDCEVLAYWGTSRENWYYRNYMGLGPGATYDGMTYRSLFKDRYHRIGRAATEAKISQLANCIQDGDYNRFRWILLSLNLLGDPEMPVFISTPLSFENVTIQHVNDSICVNASTGDFDVCFISDENPDEYYIARNTNGLLAKPAGMEGNYSVCITKPGYIPYFTQFEESKYLQNVTLTGNNNITAYRILIGSDVTTSVPNGPVNINSGQTSIVVPDGAKITKGFKVKSGATFQITNQ